MFGDYREQTAGIPYLITELDVGGLQMALLLEDCSKR
jgi:hypothetical protein